jgi:hypothetical protein
MNAKGLSTVLGIALMSAACAPGQGPLERPEWDQKKAVAIVKGVVALEQTGQPWDKVAWLTDADEAAARARKEDKPILVWGFVKGTRGPAAAPC